MIGQEVKINQKMNFEIDIDGLDSPIGFSKCGPFKGSHSESEYKEGNADVVEKEFAHTTFEDITIERGSTKDNQIYLWWMSKDKRNLTVTQFDPDGNPSVKWRVEAARVKEVRGPRRRRLLRRIRTWSELFSVFAPGSESPSAKPDTLFPLRPRF